MRTFGRAGVIATSFLTPPHLCLALNYGGADDVEMAFCRRDFHHPKFVEILLLWTWSGVGMSASLGVDMAYQLVVSCANQSPDLS